jgi:hypothetical protein
MTSPSIPPPASPPPVPGPKTKKSAWPWMLGGCGCLTLLVIGVVALVLYTAAKRNESTSKSVSSAPTEVAKLPANYPKDIPIYPGATVQYVIPVITATAPSDYSVTLVVRAPFKDVVAFYDRELPAKGWTIGQRWDHTAAAGRQGLKRPAKVAVTVSDEKDGTTSIVIGNTTNSPNW